MTFRLAFLLGSGIWLTGTAAAAPQAAPVAPAPLRLYVSPTGDDRWTGRLPEPNAARTDGPTASVESARRLVREALTRQRLAREPAQPVVVTLAGGTYFLPAPITFEPPDGGSAGAPVTYEAKAGETPVLSGGVAIAGWAVGPDGRWAVELPDVKAGRWDFAQLYVNGERRMRPRLPKQGYYKIAERMPPTGEKPGDAGKEEGKERGGAKGKPKAAPKKPPGDDRFKFGEGRLRAKWRNLNDVEVISFHPWFTSMLRIAEVRPDDHVVGFTGTTRNVEPWAHLTGGMRYLVENVAEALTEPGEWYLDKSTGVLTYLPMPGETPDRAVVVAPRLPHVLSVNGDRSRGGAVTDLRFVGLTFAHAGWTTPADGSAIPQAAVTVGGMVRASTAERVAFEGCAFTQAGTYGLEFGAGCKASRAADCRFVDLGGGGVKVGTTALPSDPADLATGITVEQNTVAHVGRVHPAACGVWVGHAADVSVAHNDIYDLYYTGVSAGWTWGYASTLNRDVRITDNHIRHLGQSVLSDLGGIYTLGASPGSVLSGNRIHDATRDQYGAWGIYYDEGSSGYVAKDNLLYRLQDGGFHQHYGAENVFANNVLLDATEVQWGPTRIDTPATPGKVVERTAVTFERNLIRGWGAASVVRNEATGQLVMSHPDKLKVARNLYWNGGKEVRFGPMSFEGWRKKGLDVDSVVADPKLPPDVDRMDWRVPDDSPAVTLIGLVPFDVSKAGRTTADPASTAGAAAATDADPRRWPRWFPPAGEKPDR